jgi:ferredoxin
LKVSIDHDLCCAHRRCCFRHPHLFEEGADSKACVKAGMEQVPPEHEADARDAAENCPEGAIRVEG